MSKRRSNAQTSDGPDQRHNHIRETIIISIFFFWILWILPYFFTNQNGLKIDSTLVLVALVPFITYLILSGRIKEISGPGGWGLKLTDAAQRRISPDDKINPEAFPVIAKQDVSPRIHQYIRGMHPNILSFDIDLDDYYRGWAVWKYIDAIEQESEFLFVLFLEPNDEFKALMKASDFKRLLPSKSTDDPELHREIRLINFLENRRAITKSLAINSTNKEALELMEKVDIDVLPVVDEQRKFAGVVTQDSILRKIMARLLST